jgi:UDP-GlcNAc:undecaprenyl-phosphate/decaprenyl-phosphate GlcNAc-1-phosphate transferase
VSDAVIAVVSLAVALVATPLAMVAARRTGTMDDPGPLKPHATPVPYLGGVAVFLGMAVGVLHWRPSVLIPLAAALVLGVLDDRFDVPAPVRLVGEIGIGVAVVVTCPVGFPGWVAVLLIATVTILLVNGVNLVDGLDAQAGGVAAVAALGFVGVLPGSGRAMAIAMAGALGGFLVFNRPPARIYLGDGGTYLLGAALTVLLARSWAPGSSTTIGTAALALVAIPVAEVASAVIRRRRGRRSLLAGDRGHPYDRLVARGWAPMWATASYLGAALVLSVAAVIMAHHGGSGIAVVVDVLLGAGLIGLSAWAGGLAPDKEACS